MSDHFGFDQRFEDAARLDEISRRSFLGAMAGAAGVALAGSSRAAAAAPAPTAGQAPGVIAPDDEALWGWVADQFLIRNEVAYMNTGTRGPSPRSVYEAQIEAIRASNVDRLSYARYVYDTDFRDGLREKMATFLGCKPSEVAFTNNTTEGMAFGTNGPDLERGDEILCTNHDHSSGAQPIHLRAARQGLQVKMLDLSDARFHPPKSPDDIVAAFDDAISSRTKRISFCQVNYTDGCVLPVKEICELARSKGILTLVDGAHPPGMMNLDLHALGCDMYAGACHKWMMAAMLTGFFYVREDVQDRIWPTIYSGPVNG
ncbi:MAG: aminotransferase class V-fold PLP-dependent enzyme, partial [Pseudomonadales bacterium]